MKKLISSSDKGSPSISGRGFICGSSSETGSSISSFCSGFSATDSSLCSELSEAGPEIFSSCGTSSFLLQDTKVKAKTNARTTAMYFFIKTLP
ncbi:MAG: hypothetical protein IJZ58_05875 [Oscillospiraceae bacterium]|nr:hypothetical protein [Oscillospiraceae bacterium]